MAQKNIDFGTFPDDPDADAIRTAFEKTQLNFDELFAARDQEVYSVNRIRGEGITVNSPTGNVVVSADIAQVRIRSSTLDLSTGANTAPRQEAVIIKGSVPFFINLPPNVAGITNITLSGTVTANNAIINSSITGNTATFSGNLTTTANISANNISSTNRLTVGANANLNSNLNVLANANVAGNVNAGNVNAGNATITGRISAVTSNISGNVNAGNVNVGNVNAGNVTTTGLISAATSNVSGNVNANVVNANYLYGDAGNLTGIIKIVNGTSYANIPIAGGNLNIVIDGVSAMTVTSTGAEIAGTANVTGNVTAGNITTSSVTANTLNGVLANSGTSNITIESPTGNVTTAVDGNAIITATSSGAEITGDLDVSGITSLGLASNVKIGGGLPGEFLQTDGDNNLTWGNSGQAQNVLYVSKSGNDDNNGLTLGSAKLTIAAAVAIATPGTTIFVKAGDYTEQNPMSLATKVTIVGDNLRTVSVRPANPTQDIFWLRNGCYITGMTFRDHLSPSAAVAFPATGAGTIVTSPYVQNCSSITTTGCGMRIDGSLATGLKSMVLDSYTQFNQGGKGIHIINMGYAQLVSIFTICCSIGVHCESGGQCSVANSNNSFGDYALVSDGQSDVLYSGTTNSFINGVVEVGGLTTRPSVNDSFRFVGDTTWYTVNSASALDAGVSVIQFSQPAGDTPLPGTVVEFFQPSFISASGQTFEYVGTGTDILTSTPRLGGIPIQENEVVQLNGGIVNWTSTDQFGDFRIGAGLLINEEAGVIEGPTFEKGLFAVLTPYILALES